MELKDKMIFCTLFDSNYIDKGLALYDSMKRNIIDFKLYIFAFDEKCLEILSDMHLKNTILISINDIMTPALQKLKKERTRAEFCWTCTPVVIECVLQKYKEKICTYIDADIYFFSSPQNVIQEFVDSGNAVGLSAHRFERNYEYGHHIFDVGKYCIQFNIFLNSREGRSVLEKWKENCADWCYSRYEDGKFGDQKYPDKWSQMYPFIYEIPEYGAGIAPWNLHLYNYVKKEGRIILMEWKGKKFPLIFYHFEGMKYLNSGRVWLNLWEPGKPGMNRKVKLIYRKYLCKISQIREYLEKNYGINFEHMNVNADLFLKGEYSLWKFFEKEGIYNGLKMWYAHRKYNIY